MRKSKKQQLQHKPPILDYTTPRSFDEYIGQERAKEVLKVLLEASHIDKKPLPSLLISGQYGIGKTTLGKLVFEKHDTKYFTYNAASLSLYKSVYVNKQINLPSGNYLMDEIHNIDAELSDLFHSKMDSQEVTIIGMTTNPGKLTAPFRSRFYLIQLEPYTIEDLQKILLNIMERRHYDFTVDEEVSYEIAKRSRQTARTLIQNLNFILDFVSTQKLKAVSKDLMLEAFDKLGIDEKGLTEIDHKYLNALPEDRPVGIQYISSKIGIDADTIEEEIEPFLMREGLVDRNNRGRFKPKPEENLVELIMESIARLEKV